jgi:hypothetical protein
MFARIQIPRTNGIAGIGSEIPHEYKMYQNYPNPFNPTTKIRFDLPKTSNTKLIIFDILGKEVATLVNQNLSPGKYEVEWNASSLGSGIYFYRLSTENFSAVKKLVLIK